MRSNLVVRYGLAVSLALVSALAGLHAQVPGRNVNVISGQTWPDGDPFLQRQNEPSVAASTRNPLHLLGGSNDYRTVDIRRADWDADELGDAWLGLFKSTDGGQQWRSGLLGGYPQDPQCSAPTGTPRSPLCGYAAGADAVVRAGSNGLFYYAGLVFDRGANGKSAIFVNRFIDNNNTEGGDPLVDLGATIVEARTGDPDNYFVDKPWLAVDIPRADSGTCTIVTRQGTQQVTQQVKAGAVYVAYTLFQRDAAGELRAQRHLPAAVHQLRRDLAGADPGQPRARQVQPGAVVGHGPGLGRRLRGLPAVQRAGRRGPDVDGMLLVAGAWHQEVRSRRGLVRKFDAEAAGLPVPRALRQEQLNAGTQSRSGACREFDQGSSAVGTRVPDQRLSDDDLRRHGTDVHRLDRARIRPAPGETDPSPTGDARVVHGHLDERHELHRPGRGRGPCRASGPPDHAVADSSPAAS